RGAGIHVAAGQGVEVAGANVTADSTGAVGAGQEPLDALLLRPRAVDVRRVWARLYVLGRRSHLHEHALAGFQVRGGELPDHEANERALAPRRHALDDCRD